MRRFIALLVAVPLAVSTITVAAPASVTPAVAVAAPVSNAKTPIATEVPDAGTETLVAAEAPVSTTEASVTTVASVAIAVPRVAAEHCGTQHWSYTTNWKANNDNQIRGAVRWRQCNRSGHINRQINAVRGIAWHFLGCQGVVARVKYTTMTFRLAYGPNDGRFRAAKVTIKVPCKGGSTRHHWAKSRVTRAVPVHRRTYPAWDYVEIHAEIEIAHGHNKKYTTGFELFHH